MMASVRRLIVLGASSVVACAGALVVAEGCTTFGEEPSEAGIPSPEASPIDAGADGNVVAVPPTALTCAKGIPIVLQLGELGAPERNQENGGVVAVSGAPLQLKVVATGIPPTNMVNGVRAYASWERTVPETTSTDLVFDVDVAAAYQGAKLYAEGGCRVGLANGDGDKTTAQLVFNGSEVFLGGRHPNDAGGDDGFRDNTPLFKFDASSPVQKHARFELSARPGSLVVRGTLGDKSASTAARLVTPISKITIDCGIIYADNSDGKGLQVQITNGVVAVCP